jgi:hypothetical protein
VIKAVRAAPGPGHCRSTQDHLPYLIRSASAYGALAEAEKAAADGDAKTVGAALRKAGKWDLLD